MSARIVFITLLSAALLSSCSSPSDTGPAHARPRTVSAQVGPLLIEAKALGEAGNYEGALSKVNDAEAAKSTPDDAYVINQMKQYFEVKSSHPSQP
jgi:hypothetical protein